MTTEFQAVLDAYLTAQHAHASIVYGIDNDDAGMATASDDDLYAWVDDLAARLWGESAELDAMRDAVGEYCHARTLTAAEWGAQADALDTLATLHAEYVEWCATQRIEMQSADEIDDSELLPAERGWLTAFMVRWDNAAERES